MGKSRSGQWSVDAGWVDHRRVQRAQPADVNRKFCHLGDGELDVVRLRSTGALCETVVCAGRRVGAERSQLYVLRWVEPDPGRVAILERGTPIRARGAGG